MTHRKKGQTKFQVQILDSKMVRGTTTLYILMRGKGQNQECIFIQYIFIQEIKWKYFLKIVNVLLSTWDYWLNTKILYSSLQQSQWLEHNLELKILQCPNNITCLTLNKSSVTLYSYPTKVSLKLSKATAKNNKQNKSLSQYISSLFGILDLSHILILPEDDSSKATYIGSFRTSGISCWNPQYFHKIEISCFFGEKKE